MSDDPSSPKPPASIDREVGLSEHRTQLSFQRTHQSLDRTLMAQIRTSLSLITFGFTIYQAFKGLAPSPISASAGAEARIFGSALVLAGMVMLTLGLVHHVRSLQHLRAKRLEFLNQGITKPEDFAPLPFTFITAALLWLIGLFAMLSIALGA